jgi:hypothetical protein
MGLAKGVPEKSRDRPTRVMATGNIFGFKIIGNPEDRGVFHRDFSGEAKQYRLKF